MRCFSCDFIIKLRPHAIKLRPNAENGVDLAGTPARLELVIQKV